MNPEEQDKHLPSLAPGPRGPVKQPSMTLTKPRKNSTACLPCKQAKRKCTGRPPPCKACQNTEAECIFDETLDLRRKVAARRTLGEMEHYRGLLYSLVESLRSADEDRIQHILETVRDSSSLDPIAAAIDASAIDVSETSNDSQKDNPGGHEAAVQQERLSADSQSRITLEKLCDIPLFRVSAKPWTTITEDDHLVSHLISLYFTWDHPLSQMFDQSLFLDHMATGHVDSDFCSPLLVNSILAVASSYSDFPEVFAAPGDATSKGLHFYAEAERLWKAEEGQISLANIQAVCLMSYVLEGQGKRQASWMMLRQAVQLSQDFGMFQAPRTRNYAWEQMAPQMQYAGSITACGVFMLNSQMSMARHRVANLQLPRTTPFPSNDLEDSVSWVPYPRSNKNECDSRPALLRYVMVAMASLAEINIEIQDLLFDQALDMNFDEMWTAAGQLYARLQKWHKNLPETLQIGEEPIPQTLFVHIRYHHIIIDLSGLLLSLGNIDPTFNPASFGEARPVQFDSAKQIAQCLCRHRELYGLRQISGQVLEATNSSALILVAMLSHDGIKDAFVEVCRCLVAFSRRLPCARSMIHDLESAARQAGISLPSEAVAVLDHKELVSSQWL